jgi:hypothetical protein
MPSNQEATLTPAETQDLHRIAGIMIPASKGYGVPAANDELIFADITRSLSRDAAQVRAALAELAVLAGGPFSALDTARAAMVAETFLASDSPAASVLGRVILQCYYRDDRVLQSVGVEPRPPFPKGHTVEQGDWSLLDAVRSRPKFWRDDRAG